MAKTLNFNTLKKRYLTITLADEKETKLLITTPTKALMDEFIAMKDSLSADDMGEDAIDELYSLCARIMSRNMGGVKVSKTDLEEILDFEDIIVFITTYTDFINEMVNSKN